MGQPGPSTALQQARAQTCTQHPSALSTPSPRPSPHLPLHTTPHTSSQPGHSSNLELQLCGGSFREPEPHPCTPWEVHLAPLPPNSLSQKWNRSDGGRDLSKSRDWDVSSEEGAGFSQKVWGGGPLKAWGWALQEDQGAELLSKLHPRLSPPADVFATNHFVPGSPVNLWGHPELTR